MTSATAWERTPQLRGADSATATASCRLGHGRRPPFGIDPSFEKRGETVECRRLELRRARDRREQRHAVDRLGHVAEHCSNFLRRDALGEQLACAATAWTGRHDRCDEIPGAGETGKRLRLTTARA